MASVTQVPPEPLMEVAIGVTTVVAVTVAVLPTLLLLAAQPDTNTAASSGPISPDQAGRRGVPLRPIMTESRLC